MTEANHLLYPAPTLGITCTTIKMLGELSKDSLKKLITICDKNIQYGIQIRSFANIMLIYSLAITLISSWILFTTDEEHIQTPAFVLTGAAVFTTSFAGLISLWYTSEISYLQFFRTRCIITIY